MNLPDTPPLPPPPPIRRRNSISTTVPLQIPTKLTIPNGTVSSSSFELISFKSSLSYTSLKDLLPSNSSATAINSPTAGSAANSTYEISIRNRLVKQAAWAYLQPMSSSPGSSGPHFLHRLWTTLSSALSFFSRAIDRFLGAISVLVKR